MVNEKTALLNDAKAGVSIHNCFGEGASLLSDGRITTMVDDNVLAFPDFFSLAIYYYFSSGGRNGTEQDAALPSDI
jgi:hypothetical protein